MIEFQSDIEKIDSNILKLGLLQGVLHDETSTDLTDLPESLTFPIKLFQEFLSGYYASKTKKVWQKQQSEITAVVLECYISTLHDIQL